MFVPFLLLVVAAGEERVEEARKGPSSFEFQFAQVSVFGSNVMAHCNRFRDYRAQPTEDPAVYRVRYREYRSSEPWKRMQATVRRNGERWVWVEGDPPRCSITVIED